MLVMFTSPSSIRPPGNMTVSGEVLLANFTSFSSSFFLLCPSPNPVGSCYIITESAVAKKKRKKIKLHCSATSFSPCLALRKRNKSLYHMDGVARLDLQYPSRKFHFQIVSTATQEWQLLTELCVTRQNCDIVFLLTPSSLFIKFSF